MKLSKEHYEYLEEVKKQRRMDKLEELLFFPAAVAGAAGIAAFAVADAAKKVAFVAKSAAELAVSYLLPDNERNY